MNWMADHRQVEVHQRSGKEWHESRFSNARRAIRARDLHKDGSRWNRSASSVQDGRLLRQRPSWYFTISIVTKENTIRNEHGRPFHLQWQEHSIQPIWALDGRRGNQQQRECRCFIQTSDCRRITEQWALTNADQNPTYNEHWEHPRPRQRKVKSMNPMNKHTKVVRARSSLLSRETLT